jgi:putative DNA methylase
MAAPLRERQVANFPVLLTAPLTRVRTEYVPNRDDRAAGLLALAAASLPIDDGFDVAFANDLAHLESYNKHHYRPNTYMHKWWARRCGSTFRLILKHLVADPAQQDYYAAGGLEGKIVLDPMMGGGTTLHEALRLGASVVGVDIDPIPVLQARATLSPVPLPALEKGFAALMAGLEAELGSLYTTHCPACAAVVPLRFVLYGAQRRCACGPVLVVDSTTLRHEANGAAVRICPRCLGVAHSGKPCSCRDSTGRPLIVEKSQQRCPTCAEPYVEELDRPYYTRYTPLAVVGDCAAHGLFFAAPSAHDRAQIAAANARRPAAWDHVADAFAVSAGPKSRDLLSRGVRSYLDLFSSRQLLYLQKAGDILPQFEPLVRLNLALLVSTSLEFNSLLCGYKGARRGDRPGAIRHTFSHHAYAFPYTALENNLLFPHKASGTLHKLFHDRIRRARRWARAPRERHLNGARPRFQPVRGEREIGEEALTVSCLDGGGRFLLQQGTAAALNLPDGSVDFVVTDPPYFDSVQYGDLATFFHVWLKQLLPGATQYDYDLSAAAVDPHANGNGQYTPVLSAIFGEIRRVLRPETGRLVFTYHHWKPQGWAALTIALQRADFALLNRYVVHAENQASVHIANMRALVHDAILVLAPREALLAPVWHRPSAVDQRDSARFTEDCATLLGWLLQERLPDSSVRRIWRDALR